jgi:Uma2 family endonuclease
VKVNVYAAGKIPEYWVVDVNGQQLLVFRDPQPDVTEPDTHTYTTQLTLGPSDTVSPLAAPNATIRVSDLLP